MDTQALIQDLNRCQGWEITESLTFQQLEGWLAERLNEWIRWDFNALVSFLYRVDISESGLRRLLKENPGEDAGLIIARMVIDRLAQKIETRKRHRRDDNARDNSRRNDSGPAGGGPDDEEAERW
jgi:hypothetical protein